MRGKVARAAAVVAAVAGAAVAAPAVASADAVLGTTCEGGWFAFTVTASGGDIPAGSAWQSQWTAASTLRPQYEVRSSPAVVTSTPVNLNTVNLTNPAPIAAGTTVVLSPSGYPLTTKNELHLILDGYGGRIDQQFATQDGEWPTC